MSNVSTKSQDNPTVPTWIELVCTLLWLLITVLIIGNLVVLAIMMLNVVLVNTIRPIIITSIVWCVLAVLLSIYLLCSLLRAQACFDSSSVCRIKFALGLYLMIDFALQTRLGFILLFDRHLASAKPHLHYWLLMNMFLYLVRFGCELLLWLLIRCLYSIVFSDTPWDVGWCHPFLLAVPQKHNSS